MILGIGIDMVDIARFNNWYLKPHSQLERIFCPSEIEYALEHQALSAQRFAVRFAAKEAFYKALCTWHQHSIPLTIICKEVAVAKSVQGVPYLAVNWQALQVPFEPLCMLSLSHTQAIALAHVTLIAPYNIQTREMT